MNLSNKSNIRGRYNSSVSGTVLYCPFTHDLENFASQATEPHPYTLVGAPVVMTANKGLISGRAPLFNTSGKLQYASSIDWALGNTFSVRYWARQLNYLDAYHTHLAIGPAANRNFRIRRHASSAPGMTVSVGGTDFTIAYVFDAVEQWKLFEVMVFGTDVYFYVDKVLEDTVSIGANVVVQDVLYVGGNSTSEWYNGYLQQLSIHKGVVI